MAADTKVADSGGAKAIGVDRLVTLRVKGVSSVDVDAAAWFVYHWGICLCRCGRLLVALGMMTPVLKHAGLYCKVKS